MNLKESKSQQELWKKLLLYKESKSNSNKVRLKKLDGVRGILALLVVFFHFEAVYLPYNLYENFIIRQSYVFVDFFFVLSGFVIALNYNTTFSIPSLLTFIKKRILRLYPLLFFSTTVFVSYMIATNYIKVLFPSFSVFENENTINITELLLHSRDTYFMTNSTPILGSERGVNYPTWSISSEMISYLTYGILFMLFPKQKVWQTIIVIIFSGVFLFWDGSYFQDGHFGFIRGLFAFNIGCLVYYTRDIKIDISKWWEIALVPVFLLLLYFLNVYMAGNSNIFLFLSFLVPILSALFLVVMIRTNYILSSFFETPLLQFLGKVSYSVYLNHALLLFILPKLAYRVLKIDNDGFSSFVVLIAILLFIVIYSRFTYLYVEIRGRKLMEKLFFGKKNIQKK